MREPVLVEKPKKKLRRAAYALATVAIVVLLLVVQPAWLARGFARAFPGIVWQVDTDLPVIALTFDDGPDPTYTPQVLELLEGYNAKATFFLIGEHARQHPELVARIRAAGHEVSNHTDSKATTFYMSAKPFEASLVRAEETLGLSSEAGTNDGKMRTGSGRKLLRPAGGFIHSSQLVLAKRRGYTCVLGSAYAFDPQSPSVAYIRWAISKNLRPGTIVVLHDAGGNRSKTVAALEGILAEANKKGLRSVTVSELLAAGKK